MADLLIELFSEEIPARMQKKASDDLKSMITKALKDAGLTFETADAYATPRRLALSVTGVPTATPDISEERRGPSTSAPEKALEGFMRGAGVTRDQLEEREEKKGTFFYAKIEKPGRAATEVIAEALEVTIRNFPWPKSQRWGTGSLKWVRPLQSILCIFDGDVVPFSIDVDVAHLPAGENGVPKLPMDVAVQLVADPITYGHRFMAPEGVSVSSFAEYKQKLLDAKVMLDPARRETLIADTAQTLASAAGLELVEDKALIAEVAGLVEWPVPMIGSFSPDFLDVPEEVLILTMRKDQKYFVTRDPATGKLAPKFIFTANIEPSDDGSVITSGNERVLSARLADAKFFWTQDLKGKLDDNLPKLEQIVFHKELGMVSDRVERMKKLSRHLAQFIPGCDADEAERAAELSKADLVSNMVNEFASLQGVMGRYYAKAQGESEAVADAIRDHYAPAGPSDICPSAPVSVAVALAEKLDTLVGFFGINQKPTGSKDPFALRRSALGVIRLITENGIRVSIADMFGFAIAGYIDQDNEAIRQNINLAVAGGESLEEKISRSRDAHQGADLVAFFGDRLKVQQRDKGVRHDLIDAVFSQGDDDLVRILNRVSALSAFLETDDGTNLLSGYKRAANILKIEEKKDGPHGGAVDSSLLELAEEKALADAISSAKADATAALESEEFEKAMGALSTLRAPIDAFFDKVIVNTDVAEVRKNRLALLSEIRAAVNTVADFGLIEG